MTDRLLTESKEIEVIAIDWICPLTHNPATPYEKGAVKRLIGFAQDIVIALDKTASIKDAECQKRIDSLIEEILGFLDLEYLIRASGGDISTMSVIGKFKNKVQSLKEKYQGGAR